MEALEHKLEHLPDSPGVYLFKDGRGTILYVGKAGSLKHRVGSYFQRPTGRDVKTLSMLEKVSDIETIVTDTEKEAFILENHLIKEHRPRYNVKLRDDKTYPCLKLTIEEPFPTLCIVRRIRKDRSLYFGPYPSATSLRETLKLIRRLFPIRTCYDTQFSRRLRPCINFGMERCLGPCSGEVTPEQYREVVHQVRMFLEGKSRDLIDRLKAKMEEAAGQLRFEAAAKIRNQIEHIERVIEKQKAVSGDFLDQDVIGLHLRPGRAVVHPLFIRAGKLLGGKGYAFPSSELPDEEILSSFLHQYYREGRFIPEEVLIPTAIPDRAFLEQRLTELKGKKVRILVPVRGDRRALLRMACENAEQFLHSEDDSEKDQEALLLGAKEKLRLRRLPKRIEGFDISNLQGGDAVGSMVTFEDGKPNKDRYRRFRIKTVEGADDYGMMYEILLRRFQKALEEADLPDLVLLDGGRGQLNVAEEVFKELNIREVDLLSLAKERAVENPRIPGFGKTEEKVFHPQYKDPFLFERHSPVLHLLDRVRDEAHRFAITYHKKLRGGEATRSLLDEIPEVGGARRKELLKHFGSVEKIRDASPEELARAPKMNRKVARTVYEFFHPAEDGEEPYKAPRPYAT